MARSRLPHGPVNGSGAGQTPRLVPRNLNCHDSLNTLIKPFKVPYKVAKESQLRSQLRAPEGGRRLRVRSKTVSYEGMELPTGENGQLDAQAGDEYGKENVLVHHVRKDALSSSRLAQDPARLQMIETALKRSFTVPIKGYVQRHSLPLTLGTKKKIELEPRPLHDPSDEFAIVLYDPSVDGDMIIKDSSDTPLTRDASNRSGAGTGADGDANLKHDKHVHPRFLSNGLKNKSLKELLGEDINDDQHSKKGKKFPNIPVVIDPKLAKILRPHQVEGVRFLYRCVTGLVMKDFLDSERVRHIDSGDTSNKGDTSSSICKDASEKIVTDLNVVNRGAYGCIMADEMGLGKTLQCIALMWTLLRQGPQGKKLIDKCIIVCPSSLVNNWANELIKWLGPNTLSPLAIDGKKSSLVNGGNSSVSMAIKNWGQSRGRNIVKPVLIISYETLRRNVDQLKNCEIGLLLADEGHRLKNSESLTFTSLDSINCPRRVILSGTPIQNDLSEYFALLNFSNPGLLGSRLDFRKNFEIPILLSRDALATEKEIEKGQIQLQKLSDVVSRFIIRRTNDILSKYLPCKYEHVIFVNLTPFQKKIYQNAVTSWEIDKLDKKNNHDNNDKNNDITSRSNSNDSGNNRFIQPLKAIGILKKLCNHPDLINFEDDLPNSENLDIPDDYIVPVKGKNTREIQTEFSGKFSILERFLSKIKKESDDKIVLISNYTQTLDLIEKFCRIKRYSSIRLDGTLNINKRQKLVDRFNDPEGQEFIFLLSSKAGGCGINLIGANRLILLDPDWNPAADQQALARVWRDGQKKDCFIYRFISTGTIEEKIYQRQSMKMSLSSCVVDAKEDVERLFSADNLRQLFQYNKKTICETHETYNCKRCDTKTGKQLRKSDAMLYGDPTTWNHLNHKGLEKTNDHLLRNEFHSNDISYVFQYISH
ncbi:hypothetical protein HG535_0H01700 [Zygotorulaspora mrakii]|uniref:DNA helicase n=1 Tax=Zygotorulaspora mrakii TaxID=42260 RepID=A0A7H9B8J0_ZYGMR|nr:uncharacterized protein HG535_0H01700 [Zygotorulaspora mrakii]QLG74843.1 hypothetical protein HG535_0H01700 [Zygotorulaspora mrakii]